MSDIDTSFDLGESLDSANSEKSKGPESLESVKLPRHVDHDSGASLESVHLPKALQRGDSSTSLQSVKLPQYGGRDSSPEASMESVKLPQHVEKGDSSMSLESVKLPQHVERGDSSMSLESVKLPQHVERGESSMSLESVKLPQHIDRGDSSMSLESVKLPKHVEGGEQREVPTKEPPSQQTQNKLKQQVPALDLSSKLQSKTSASPVESDDGQYDSDFDTDSKPSTTPRNVMSSDATQSPRTPRKKDILAIARDLPPLGTTRSPDVSKAKSKAHEHTTKSGVTTTHTFKKGDADALRNDLMMASTEWKGVLDTLMTNFELNESEESKQSGFGKPTSRFATQTDCRLTMAEKSHYRAVATTVDAEADDTLWARVDKPSDRAVTSPADNQKSLLALYSEKMKTSKTELTPSQEEELTLKAVLSLVVEDYEREIGAQKENHPIEAELAPFPGHDFTTDDPEHFFASYLSSLKSEVEQQLKGVQGVDTATKKHTSSMRSPDHSHPNRKSRSPSPGPGVSFKGGAIRMGGGFVGFDEYQEITGVDISKIPVDAPARSRVRHSTSPRKQVHHSQSRARLHSAQVGALVDKSKRISQTSPRVASRNNAVKSQSHPVRQSQTEGLKPTTQQPPKPDSATDMLSIGDSMVRRNDKLSNHSPPTEVKVESPRESGGDGECGEESVERGRPTQRSRGPGAAFASNNKTVTSSNMGPMKMKHMVERKFRDLVAEMANEDSNWLPVKYLSEMILGDVLPDSRDFVEMCVDSAVKETIRLMLMQEEVSDIIKNTVLSRLGSATPAEIAYWSGVSPELVFEDSTPR